MTIIIPDPITKPYCNTGAKVTTPVGTSTTVANQETGFPPLQATPLNAGGIPVDIEQFNGVLNLYSQQIQALVSGAKFTFNQAVSDANGGYPLGIILYCESNNSYQKSLIANNTFNFVTTPSYIDDGINWKSIQSIHDLININLSTTNINTSGNTVNFGGNIVATSGNITALAGNINGELIIASMGLTVKNGHKLTLFNTAETFATSIKSYPTSVNQSDYILPPTLPTISGQSLVSDTSGNMSWKINEIIPQQTSTTPTVPISINTWTDICPGFVVKPGKYLIGGTIQLILANDSTTGIGFDMYIGFNSGSGSTNPSDYSPGLNSSQLYTYQTISIDVNLTLSVGLRYINVTSDSVLLMQGIAPTGLASRCRVAGTLICIPMIN